VSLLLLQNLYSEILFQFCSVIKMYLISTCSSSSHCSSNSSSIFRRWSRGIALWLCHLDNVSSKLLVVFTHMTSPRQRKQNTVDRWRNSFMIFVCEIYLYFLPRVKFSCISPALRPATSHVRPTTWNIISATYMGVPGRPTRERSYMVCSGHNDAATLYTPRRLHRVEDDDAVDNDA